MDTSEEGLKEALITSRTISVKLSQIENCLRHNVFLKLIKILKIFILYLHTEKF